MQPDDAQLTFLFEKHSSGVLTLTPERGALLAEHLTDTRLLRHLLVPNAKPVYKPRRTAAQALAAVVRAKMIEYSAHIEPGIVAGSEELRITPQATLLDCPDAEFALVATYPPESPSLLGNITVNVPEHDGDTQTTYHIRGGRVWQRVVRYAMSNRDRPFDVVLQPLSVSPSMVDTRGDDLVQAALSRVSLGELNEDMAFGVPVSEATARRLVKWLRLATGGIQ